MKDLKIFKKNDIFVILIVIILALAMLIPSLFSKENLKATVYLNGKIINEIDLDKVENSYIIKPSSIPKTEITVEKGRICFSHSECRDKLCVKNGWLDSNGQTAACLPAKVVISVTGNDNEIDAMTY